MVCAAHRGTKARKGVQGRDSRKKATGVDQRRKEIEVVRRTMIGTEGCDIKEVCGDMEESEKEGWLNKN